MSYPTHATIMNNTTHATNKTIAKALRILAGDIKSQDDVPAATLRQAATRIEELREQVKRLKAKVERSKRALDLVIPSCEYLHHPKQYRHESGQACMCESIVREAKEDGR